MVETATRQAEDEGAWTIELRGDEPRDAEREQPGKRGGDGGLPVADVASDPKPDERQRAEQNGGFGQEERKQQGAACEVGGGGEAPQDIGVHSNKHDH